MPFSGRDTQSPPSTYRGTSLPTARGRLAPRTRPAQQQHYHVHNEPSELSAVEHNLWLSYLPGRTCRLHRPRPAHTDKYYRSIGPIDKKLPRLKRRNDCGVLPGRPDGRQACLFLILRNVYLKPYIKRVTLIWVYTSLYRSSTTRSSTGLA